MNGSIFDRIVTNENSFTELFVTLCRYRVFRAEVVAFLLDSKSGGLSAEWRDFSFESDEIETQTQTEGERPDIVIRSARTGHLLVMEVKTSTATELRDSQRDGYRRFFADAAQGAGPGELVFIVPRGYGHVSEIDTTRAGVHVAYWEDFIGWIEEKELDELNPYIGEFVKFSKSLFGMTVPVVQSADVPLLYDQSTAALIERVVATVEAVHNGLKSTAIAVGRLSRTEYDYGFFVQDGGQRIGYFGTAAYHWMKFGQALCIGVRPESVDRLMKELPGLVSGQLEDGLQYLGIPAGLWNASSDTTVILSTVFRLAWNVKTRPSDLSLDVSAELDEKSPLSIERSLVPFIAGLWSLVDTVRIRLQHSGRTGFQGDDEGSFEVIPERPDSDWRWFSVRSRESPGLIRFGWVYGGWWSEYGSPLFVGAKQPACLNVLDSGDNGTDPGSEEGWHYRAVRPAVLKARDGHGDVADACVSLILDLIDAGAR